MFVVYLLLSLVGFGSSYFRRSLSLSDPLDLLEGKQVKVSGIVSSFPRYSTSGLSFLLKVRKAQSENLILEHPKSVGTIYVFVREGQELPISYHFEVEISGTLTGLTGAVNRGDFSMKEYLRPLEINYELFVPSKWQVISSKPYDNLASIFYKLKLYLIKRAYEAFQAPYNQLFLGLTIGDSAVYFPTELKEIFRKAGLTHLLVVSGSQVSLFFLIVGLLLLRFESPFSYTGKAVRVLKYPLIFLLILGYSVLTGFEPSIQRAFIVSSLVLLAHFFFYEVDALHVIGQAGLIILISRPAEILSVSFQLTFAATVGLILGIRAMIPLISYLSSWLKAFLVLLAATFGAQIMVFPLILYYFGQITPYGLISNLVAIPVSFFAMLMAVSFYIFGSIPLLGDLIRITTHLILSFLYWWAKTFASLPGSSLSYVPISGVACAISCLLLFLAIIELGLNQKRIRFVIGAFLILLSTFVLYLPLKAFQDNLPQILVYYLRSGNASLYIDAHRNGIIFVNFPSSPNSQEVLIERLSSLLSRSGVKALRSMIILSDSIPDRSIIGKLSFKPELLVSSVDKTVFPLSRKYKVALDTLPTFYFNVEGKLVLYQLDLNKGVEVYLSVLKDANESLNVLLPPIPSRDSSASETKRILIIPGSFAKKKASQFKRFVVQNKFNVVISQGRSDISNLVYGNGSGLKVYSQLKKSEIDIKPDGSVSSFRTNLGK